MEKHIKNEKTGISYTLHGNYYLPDLVLPDTDNRLIGIYGKRHSKYLKQNRRVVYTELLTSGKLHSYLADIDEQACERLELLVKQMAEQEGVTERLKAENQLLWIQKMSNIRNRAIEIVNNEIIYS
jgi:ribonuclease HII